MHLEKLDEIYLRAFNQHLLPRQQTKFVLIDLLQIIYPVLFTAHSTFIDSSAYI